MGVKVWFLETRPQFLLLSVVLAFLGACIAWYYTDAINVGYALLAGLGLVLTHISVNVLNDYFDYKSGIDLKVQRSPFNGGSGLLPAGLLTPRQALWFGLICLFLAVPIGVYFVVVQGWQLLPLLAVAAFCVVFYSPVILKGHWPEWSPGLGLGMLPVMGAYFAQTGSYTLTLVFAAVPSFILVHNLLLLNEFPDAEADKTDNRKTLPITLGKPKAAMVYSAMTVAVYLWIIGGVVFRLMPVWTLLALLTLPLAVKAIRGSLKPDDMSRLGPAMAFNVMAVLLTQLLLGVGYILAAVL